MKIVDRLVSLYTNNQGFFGMSRTTYNFNGGRTSMQIGNIPIAKIIDSRTQRKGEDLRLTRPTNGQRTAGSRYRGRQQGGKRRGSAVKGTPKRDHQSTSFYRQVLSLSMLIL